MASDNLARARALADDAHAAGAAALDAEAYEYAEAIYLASCLAAEAAAAAADAAEGYAFASRISDDTASDSLSVGGAAEYADHAARYAAEYADWAAEYADWVAEYADRAAEYAAEYADWAADCAAAAAAAAAEAATGLREPMMPDTTWTSAGNEAFTTTAAPG